MSIRLRFTLLYTVILALTLTFFGVTVYAIQYRAAHVRSSQLLVTFARRLVEARRIEVGLGGRWPRPPAERAIRLIREPFRDPEVYYQLRSADGQVIQRSGNLDEETLPLSPAGEAAVKNNRVWIEVVRIGGERVLVHSELVRLPDNQFEIVQVARSLADTDNTLVALRRNLLIGGGVVVLAAFGIGWFFSGVILRPIVRITETAQAIGAEQDFSRRVTYRGPNDEVGHLVTTFNTMLSQLQTAYQRMEQALQMQRRFVADVSHELRTPLTTIRGNIELLRREPPIPAEDRVAVMTDIAGETDRLIRLVNDLLMLEHSDAGQRLRQEAVPVAPVIEEACHQITVLDPDRKIVRSGPEDVAIMGDRDAFKQVLLILLDNAITYSDGEIEVLTEAEDTNVRISVRDHGPGIAPEVLPHIFERFYRGDEARSKPGAGLGLSIARALVEAQKGVIEVESQLGQGSIFTVSLPRAK